MPDNKLIVSAKQIESRQLFIRGQKSILDAGLKSQFVISSLWSQIVTTSCNITKQIMLIPLNLHPEYLKSSYVVLISEQLLHLATCTAKLHDGKVC